MFLHQHYELFTNWLHFHPQWAITITFIVAFAECIVIIGSIIPGSITMTAIGILIGSGVIPLWVTLFWAVLGAFIGDSISYFLGLYFKDRIRDIWPFNRYPAIFITGQSFVLQHGGKSIFIGRFVGPVRAIVPVIAGMFDMKPLRYFLASIPAAVLWAPAYMLPGFLIGSVALEMPPNIAKNLIIVVLLCLVVLWLLYKAIYWIYQKTHRYFNKILDAKWALWQTQPGKRFICNLLKNADRPHQRGQIFSAIFCIIALSLFLFLAFFILKMQNPFLISSNHFVYHLLRGIRTATLDKVMVILSGIGYPHILSVLSVFAMLFFLFSRRFAALFHFASGVLAATVILFCFKYFFYNPRPIGVIHPATTSSFPSGHTTISIIYYGLIAFFLSRSMPKSIRQAIYLIAVMFFFLIGFSRLYLNAHWLTDVIAGALLSSAILIVTIISYRRLEVPKIPVKSFIVLLAALFIGNLSWYFHSYYSTDLQKYHIAWRTKNLSAKNWWQETLLPNASNYRRNRLGHPVEFLNIQWAGTINAIRESLEQKGFKDIHTRDYITTLKKLAGQHAPLPHVAILPKLYNDHYPILEMVKIMPDEEPPVVLRLWPSDIHLLPSETLLWVGTLYYDTTHKRFLFIRHKFGVLSRSRLKQLFESFYALRWQIKFIDVQPLLLKKKMPNNIILVKIRSNF